MDSVAGGQTCGRSDRLGFSAAFHLRSTDALFICRDHRRKGPEVGVWARRRCGLASRPSVVVGQDLSVLETHVELVSSREGEITVEVDSVVVPIRHLVIRALT